MVWPRVKEGRGGYHQEYANTQVPGKRRSRPKKEMAAHQDAMKEYKMTEDMAQNGSVWHMETKTGQRNFYLGIRKLLWTIFKHPILVG